MPVEHFEKYLRLLQEYIFVSFMEVKSTQ